MALYRGSTKLSGIGQSFNPENTGTEGQVLTKTCSGYAYCDPQGGDNGPMVDLLVVGGGGGGGYYGGGGGGGTVLECLKEKLDSTNYQITIGAGGDRGGYCDGCYCPGCNGGDTCFGDIKAYGGGGGGSCTRNGSDGGNGGGAGVGTCSKNAYRGGHGKMGFQGGASNVNIAGGGGGAGGPGDSGTYSCPCYLIGGAGGQGKYIEWAGGCYFGTGGGGVSLCMCAVEPFLGGGKGWARYGGGSTDASYYGGGGGGLCSSSACGCGCQGIVIVRYKTDGSCGITSATGGTITTDGDYTVHTFTSDGTFCITG